MYEEDERARCVGGGFIRETNRQIREELESLFSAFGRGYVGALAFRCFPIQLNKTQGHQTASHGFSTTVLFIQIKFKWMEM